MALSDIYSNLLIWVRWLHVLAGMLWIGHLYFCDFVIFPSQRITPSSFLPLAVSWLRWVATLAVASGLLLLSLAYFYTPGSGFGPTPLLIAGQVITDRAAWIFIGMALAFLMWFQVWFVVVPAQSQLSRGTAPSNEIPTLELRIARALRRATLLSGPMLFAMLAPSHYGAMNWITVLVVLVVGAVLVACAAAVVGKWTRANSKARGL
jgi:Urate oxidase N-terminal